MGREWQWAIMPATVDDLLVASFLLEMHLNKRSQLISAGTDIKKEWDLVC